MRGSARALSAGARLLGVNVIWLGVQLCHRTYGERSNQYLCVDEVSWACNLQSMARPSCRCRRLLD